jgi:5-hydroxyisourate hydrolase-like protein (transthyretin family)
MQRKMTILAGAGGAAALALTAAAALALAPAGHGPTRMFDADGNGELTLAELQRGTQTIFEQADADKDGRVSGEEMRAQHDRMGRGHHRGRGGRHGGRGDHGGRGGLHLDSDGDGAVTLAEAQSQLQSHFAQLDSNRDGRVTKEETEAAHRALHGIGKR